MEVFFFLSMVGTHWHMRHGVCCRVVVAMCRMAAGVNQSESKKQETATREATYQKVANKWRAKTAAQSAARTAAAAANSSSANAPAQSDQPPSARVSTDAQDTDVQINDL